MEAVLIQELNEIKEKIPLQTYRTIIGQMRSGDLNGATVGIDRLKRKLARGKAMCGSCKHVHYCGRAYKKDHWCGNHQKREVEKP